MNLSPVIITTLCQLCLGLSLPDGDGYHLYSAASLRKHKPRTFHSLPPSSWKKNNFLRKRRLPEAENNYKTINLSFTNKHRPRKRTFTFSPFFFDRNENFWKKQKVDKRKNKSKKEFSFKFRNYYDNDAFVRRNFIRPSFIPFYFNPPMLLRKKYHDHGHMHSGTSENINLNVDRKSEVSSKPLSDKSFGLLGSLSRSQELSNSLLGDDKNVVTSLHVQHKDAGDKVGAGAPPVGSIFVGDSLGLNSKLSNAKLENNQNTGLIWQNSDVVHNLQTNRIGMQFDSVEKESYKDLSISDKLKLKRPGFFSSKNKNRPVVNSRATKLFGFHTGTFSEPKSDHSTGFFHTDEQGVHTSNKNGKNKWYKYFDSVQNPDMKGFHDTESPLPSDYSLEGKNNKPVGTLSADSFGAFHNKPLSSRSNSSSYFANSEKFVGFEQDGQQKLTEPEVEKSFFHDSPFGFHAQENSWNTKGFQSSHDHTSSNTMFPEIVKEGMFEDNTVSELYPYLYRLS